MYPLKSVVQIVNNLVEFGLLLRGKENGLGAEDVEAGFHEVERVIDLVHDTGAESA